jgi:D-tyrosyl-tRNA(Tyr) deacylase
VRVVAQRVSRASVSVEGETIARIGHGFLLLVGIAQEDGEEEVRWMAEKVAGLRVFADEEDRMNRSLDEVGGEVLAVSQFTLYGDCRKGRRPSFTRAAAPAEASRLFDRFVESLRLRVPVQTGRFGAMMSVDLVNDGPVTILLEREAGEGDSANGG